MKRPLAEQAKRAPQFRATHRAFRERVHAILTPEQGRILDHHSNVRLRSFELLVFSPLTFLPRDPSR